MDLITIILPVYNGESYIANSIESLLKQTYKNLEIIFVDDGSTDKTKDIIKKYQKKYKYIKYFYQDNNKQGSARNNGLRKAKGKYVLFIDSDDYIDNNMVVEMYNYISKGNYDIVLCDYYICKNGNKDYVYCYNEPFVDNDNVSLKEYLLSTLSPSNKMYKKDFLINNNFKFLEGQFYEDFASIPTLVKYQPKIGYISKPYLYYNHTENSTMRSNNYKKSYEDIFPACEFLNNELKSYTEYRDEVEYIFIYHLLYNFSILFNQYNKKDNLRRINKFIEMNYPKWYNNAYYRRQRLKFKVLCYLFYKNHSNVVNFMRRCKLKNDGKDK